MLLVFAACAPLRDWPVEDDPVGTPESRVAVTPLGLDFGQVSVNNIGESTLSFIVQNLGDDAVTVSGHDEPIGDEGFEVLAEPFFSLGVGEAAEVHVRFAPATESTAYAQLRVDPGGELVELSGAGLAPVLALEAVDVPSTVVGCSGVATVTLRNEGSETLSIEEISLVGSDYLVTGWNADVAPGDTELVELSFTPGGGGDRGAVLTVSSNDPLWPEFAVTLEGLGYEGERVEEGFAYRPTQPTDAIFVLEPGATDGDARLAPGLEAYVDTLSATNVDFQLTALGTAGACPVDEPAYATTSDTDLGTLRVLDRAFDDAAGAWDGDLLGLALAAMEETLDGGCLDGFRRAGADLDLVIVAERTPTRDVELAAADLAALVDDPGALRVSALVPRGGACAASAEAYAELAQAYGGAVGDLCDADWTDVFEAFATLPAIEAAVTYALAEWPVPETIEVRVDGANYTGWSYDERANSLVFVTESAPSLGAQVTITYLSAVSCE
ncbi:MAG: choice-of-anchor D domain-containing protein [Deltaproteobacteria bacterium]|nr:choice-of-anchor D domain-containing protein [Deltaproteobacteria bacterium]